MKIKLENITIDYNNLSLLKELTTEFEDGKLSCLLGSSGSGKTTILKIIAGVSDQYTGKLFFGELDVTSLPVQKRKIGWVPQQQLLFPGMSVFENIAYGLRDLSKIEINTRVEEVAKLVGASHLLKRSPERLSGGERQRVAIARALAPEPDILLLDEPFSSLDAPEREIMAITMREIHLGTDVTTIHVTHSLREAELLADKIYVLSSGKILQSGIIADLISNPLSSEVAKLLGVTNVLLGWEGHDAVIIPVNAIQIDLEGEYEVEVINSIRGNIIVKLGEYRLEMKSSSNLTGKFRISIDESAINYIKP